MIKKQTKKQTITKRVFSAAVLTTVGILLAAGCEDRTENLLPRCAAHCPVCGRQCRYEEPVEYHANPEYGGECWHDDGDHVWDFGGHHRGTWSTTYSFGANNYPDYPY